MVIALSASGFAAWVISNDANKTADGSVQVGAVTDKAIEMTEIVFDSDIKNIVFEPKATDRTGRVQYDGTPANSENLQVTFSTTIKNFSVVKDLYLDFNNIPAGVKAAIKAGYIVAPSWLAVSDDGTITGTTEKIVENYVVQTAAEGETLSWTLSRNESNEATLRFTIRFEWGEKFGAQNPGDYYDTGAGGQKDEDGNYLISFDELRQELHTFKAIMHGITLEEYLENYYNPYAAGDAAALDALPEITYEFTLYARA